MLPEPSGLSGETGANGANEAENKPLHTGQFSGRVQFEQLVRDALATAAREGWREIVLCDATFSDWPLGERSVDASLRAWSKTGRKMTLLAKHYRDVAAQHHRFVAWRGQWSHIIEARAVASADVLEITSGIYSNGWVMRRNEPVRSIGVCSTEPARRVALREEIDGWLLKSSAAFAATTLGL